MSLFNKDARYVVDGTTLDINTFEALQPIFDAYIKMGHSPREIAHVMMLTIFDIECSAVLGVTPPKEG